MEDGLSALRVARCAVGGDTDACEARRVAARARFRVEGRIQEPPTRAGGCACPLRCGVGGAGQACGAAARTAVCARRAGCVARRARVVRVRKHRTGAALVTCSAVEVDCPRSRAAQARRATRPRARVARCVAVFTHATCAHRLRERALVWALAHARARVQERGFRIGTA